MPTQLACLHMISSRMPTQTISSCSMTWWESAIPQSTARRRSRRAASQADRADQRGLARARQARGLCH